MVFGTCHTLPYYAILTHALDFGTPESWTEFVKFVQLCHLVCVSKWQGVAVRRERLKWGYNLVLPIFVQNDLFGHGDTTACLKQIVSGTSLRKWKPSHTHTHSTRYTLTLSYTYIFTQAYTHTQHNSGRVISLPVTQGRKLAGREAEVVKVQANRSTNRTCRSQRLNERGIFIPCNFIVPSGCSCACVCVCSFLWCSHI